MRGVINHPATEVQNPTRTINRDSPGPILIKYAGTHKERLTMDARRQYSNSSLPPFASRRARLMAALGKKEEREPEIPPHLCPLRDTEWALWRAICLRAAGFSIDEVLELSFPECAKAADELLSALASKQSAQDNALKALMAAWERAEADRAHLLDKAIQRVKKGKVPAPELYAGRASVDVESFRIALEGVDRAQSAFDSAYEDASKKTSEKLREMAGNDRFREAVIWQNRHAVHTGLNSLLRKSQDSSSRGSKQRQQEELVASYVQRYSTKNDTIGFFGPVGWADITDDYQGLRVKPGHSLLASREVYFEVWCIDAIADAISRDERVRKYVAPRRMPYLHISRGEVYLPSRKWGKIDPRRMTILQSCDGEMRAIDIARLLVEERRDYDRHEEVYEELEKMQREGLVKWKLEVPVELYPERTLRKVLERIEESEVRQAALAKLEEIERRREAIKLAAGNAAELEEAIRDMEEHFSEMTGGKARRSEGEMYAARTLVYEDCRRDVEVKIGRKVIEEMGKPLSLMMKSARWYTKEAARELRKELEGVYQEMVRSSGRREVDCATYWYRVQPVLYGREDNVMERAEEEFRRKWRKVLGVDGGRKEQEYEYEEMRRRVEEEFEAEGPGWKYARYHSPDVMIAARGVEEIERGDYLLVMGELHSSVNTLSSVCRLSQHPNPEQLEEAVDKDFPEPRFIPLASRSVSKSTLRTRHELIAKKDFRVIFASDSIVGPGTNHLTLGELIVVMTASGLAVKTRDGRHRFDLLDALGSTISSLAYNQFKLMKNRGHTPRLKIGKLVIQRESWGKPASEMEFATQKEGRNRFLGARRWREAEGMPRYVFVKSPVEVKPMYVDFESPIYVDLMSKVVRRTMERKGGEAIIGVTEMLPGPEEVWLPDADDRRYTSELRIIAVDLNV